MIIQGIRGFEFERFLHSLWSRSSTCQPYVKQFLTPQVIASYEKIFVHKMIQKDYEFYEFIGDASLNKCVVWYLIHRFPFLQHEDGVYVLTRLKHTLISSKTFAKFAEKLGFLPYITRDDECDRQLQATLEDVFEAWFGLTEYWIDYYVVRGIGYRVCYEIMASLLNEETISLRYEDIIDAKTRLKELFDAYPVLGTLHYDSSRIENEYHTTLVRKKGKDTLVLARDKHHTKADSQQRAAENALIELRKEGFFKEQPAIFQYIKQHQDKFIIN